MTVQMFIERMSTLIMKWVMDSDPRHEVAQQIKELAREFGNN